MKIAICMRGGIIQKIRTDKKDLEVTYCDFDTDSTDELKGFEEDWKEAEKNLPFVIF